MSTRYEYEQKFYRVLDLMNQQHLLHERQIIEELVRIHGLDESILTPDTDPDYWIDEGL